MGNQQSRGQQRDKPFRDALRVVIADNDFRRLRKIAVALVSRAEKGDVAAIKEIADRLDGRVPQAIGGSDDLPPIGITQIVRTLVDPKHSDG